MATLPKSLVQRRTNSLDSERESFEKSQAISIQKAINTVEGSVKEKHVRFILIGTHHERGPYTFWEFAMRLPVQENPILAWKFCYVVHKLLREGHDKCIPVSFRYMNKFADLGRLWGLLNEGYGRLIELYCALILQKLKFHARYQFACDIFDYMEKVLSLQAAVFGSLDMARANSMTNSGQCRLAPLICCIQDSSQLYDFAVKVLFHLHARLPADTLQGHRDRFMAQFRQLRGFYANCANLQYFKTLVQVPSLPPSPPNLLKASELNSHVRPVVVLPPQPVEAAEVAEDLIDTSSPVNQMPDSSMAGAGSPPPPPRNSSVDHELGQRKDAIIEQLLKELEVARMEAQRVRLEDDTVAMELRLQQATLEGQLRAEQNNVRQLQGQLAARLESHQVSAVMQDQLEQLEKKCKSSDDKFLKMKGIYTKLREEHIRLLRAKAELEKKLQQEHKKAEEEKLTEPESILSSRSGLLLAGIMEAVVDGAVSELDIPPSQDRFLQNAEMAETTLKSLRRAEGTEEEAQLQATCFALVHQIFQLLQSAKANAHHCPSVEAGHEIITRARTVGLNSIELFKRLRIGEVDTSACLASLRELVTCIESQRLKDEQKNQAEDIGHLLSEELAQMDQAIADATKRISEIFAKSRGSDEGVKLEVNSRILGACQLLMGAVTTLVKAARHLQEEIGGFSKEFYTKNHRWTEGLISAAKVVGIAANLLVDAADRCVSGDAKMEELIVASQEISAATAQLLVASKVKADRQSTRLAALGAASKAVMENTANVVATVKSCRQQVDESQDKIEGLSLHQAKRREMELQLHVLELETELEKERLRLGALRRRNYHE
ncbi:huntington interacting protein related 1-like isoform X2 [Varroa jacobsoni]|uniref:huntington interacting protein related 1-like isoform X2 n=1 Tax=Varroa jacobsoni TaxID=62625 RepID=UPI000BF5A4C2|nr:huntington interacting protein related 1-like isoform X2 [Varroa jacobsoni]